MDEDEPGMYSMCLFPWQSYLCWILKVHRVDGANELTDRWSTSGFKTSLGCCTLKFRSIGMAIFSTIRSRPLRPLTIAISWNDQWTSKLSKPGSKMVSSQLHSNSNEMYFWCLPTPWCTINRIPISMPWLKRYLVISSVLTAWQLKFLFVDDVGKWSSHQDSPTDRRFDRWRFAVLKAGLERFHNLDFSDGAVIRFVTRWQCTSQGWQVGESILNLWIHLVLCNVTATNLKSIAYDEV